MIDLTNTQAPAGPATVLFIYAHINEQDIVYALTQAASALNSPIAILVSEYDESLLGQRYDREASDAAGQPVFVHVPVASAPEVRRISVGAFFDRFGPAKWGILADAAPTVAAVVKDASVRRYIDLDSPDLPAGIALLQQAGHDVDAEAIISAQVQESERP